MIPTFGPMSASNRFAEDGAELATQAQRLLFSLDRPRPSETPASARDRG
jgi:hypothetical protein